MFTYKKNGILLLNAISPGALTNFAGQDLYRFDGRVRIVNYRPQLVEYVYMNDPKKTMITQTHRQGFAIPVIAEIYNGQLAHERVVKLIEADFDEMESLLKNPKGLFKFGIENGIRIKFFLNLKTPLYEPQEKNVRDLTDDELFGTIQQRGNSLAGAPVVSDTDVFY